MPQEISVIDSKPRPLAVVRVTTVLSRWPREFRYSLDKVYAAVRAGRVKQIGHNVMVYFPRQDGMVDIECGVETDGNFAPASEVRFSETPAGVAVTATHIGPYEELGATHRAIVEWSRTNAYRLTGVCWEIYGDWVDDPAKLRTDIFHLAGG